VPFLVGLEVNELAQDFYEALQNHDAVTEWLYQVRDLTVVRVTPVLQMVFACDSLGGIGEKPLDVAHASAQTVGHFSLRVPLVEVIAAGAEPFLIIDTLSVEAGAYGQAILAGIKELAAAVGLKDKVHFNGSMEKNLVPLQTGLGVTVAGMVDAAHVQLGTAQSDDVLLLVGKPKSAPTHEIRIGDPEIVSLHDVRWLRAQDGVHDMVPVGSQGVAHEAQQLAASVQMRFVFEGNSIRDTGSGGPHTSVLVACRADKMHFLIEKLQCPVRVIGRLVEQVGNAYDGTGGATAGRK
jgi:hypothetical protein